MDAILENMDEKLSDSGFGIAVDVSLDSDCGVFRRYHVGNNPVNFVDPWGLVDWKKVGVGALKVVGGGLTIAGSVVLDATVIGAPAGVVIAVTGGTAIGSGIVDIIIGLADKDVEVPTPSYTTMCTLAVTGDMDKAKRNDLIVDGLLLGVSIGSTATRIPSTVDAIGMSTDYINIGISISDMPQNGGVEQNGGE